MVAQISCDLTAPAISLVFTAYVTMFCLQSEKIEREYIINLWETGNHLDTF